MNSLLKKVVTVLSVALFIFSLTATPSFAMNKAELIDSIAFEKADSKRALDALIDNTKQSLSRGDRVALVGFGTFSVSKRAARKGRNPQTGKEIKIPAKKVVKFKPGAELSDKVKMSGGDQEEIKTEIVALELRGQSSTDNSKTNKHQVKCKGLRCDGDLPEAASEKASEQIKRAEERTKANGRKTVKARDA